MVGDPELPGPIGDDNCSAHQAMMADGAPDRSFTQRPQQRPVEDIDGTARQMFQPYALRSKHLFRVGGELLDQ